MARGFGASSLTDLAKIDGSLITNGDTAIVIDSSSVYHFSCVTTGIIDNPPYVIEPDENAGSKRWSLKSLNYLSNDVTMAGGTSLSTNQIKSIPSGAGEDGELWLTDQNDAGIKIKGNQIEFTKKIYTEKDIECKRITAEILDLESLGETTFNGDIYLYGTLFGTGCIATNNLIITQESFWQEDAPITSPAIVASNTTLCPNLNADLLDGHHSTDFISSDGSSPFTGLVTFNAGITNTGTLTNVGNIELTGNLNIVGNIDVDDLVIDNDLTVTGDLGVTGDATISTDLLVNGTLGLAAGTTVNDITTTITDPGDDNTIATEASIVTFIDSEFTTHNALTQKGTEGLSLNTTSISGTFNEEFSDTNYSLVVTLRNQIDSPPSIYSYIITNKTTVGFEVTFSGVIDSNNYRLDWIAINK